ncbi:unnamed protein product [Calypogeia fissa]
MGTDSEIGDDDLEQLLEFDDSDPIAALNTGTKQQPPSKSPTSERRAEPTRSTPGDSDAVIPGNSPEELQAAEKEATEDGDKSSDEGEEERSHSRTSLRIGRRGHDGSQHSFGEPDEQDLNEESSSPQYKTSDDVGAECSDEEELMPLKQRFSRTRPDRRHNVEETDDEDADQDVILLSPVGTEVASKERFGRELPHNRHNVVEDNDEDPELHVRLPSDVRRSTRASVDGGHGSSAEIRGRANKRIRQDGNVGTGWDDPIVVDDFPQRGMDCSQGGVSGDGRRLQASPVLSSPERPLVQKAGEDRQGCHTSGMELADSDRDCPPERATSPPATVLGYRIPGPAGALQNCLNSTSNRGKGLTHMEKYCGAGRLSYMPTYISAAETLNFREGPWLAAMEFLNDGDPSSGNHSSRTTIVTIKASKRHIPQLAGIINTAVPNGFGDLTVTLKDPTGTIGGTIHRKVLTKLEDGPLITPGAVIILRKVAVFSPTPFKHYLNITINNVDKIFGKDTTAPRRRRNAISDKDDLGTTGRDHPIPDPGPNDISRMQTAARVGYVSETIAPNIGNSDSQRVADITYTVDNSKRIQTDNPPGTGTIARNSLPSPAILENAIDSRTGARTGTVGDPTDPTSELPTDARASQEAIAKAAGWDFSEDVELLLADDFF